MRMTRSRTQTTLLACSALSAISLIAWAPPADACGGLFCSNNPVDQNAERILFEVEPDGAMSATVEIAFTGDPESFSWIIPVTETPSSMEVAPMSALQLLDVATGISIIPPPTSCDGDDGRTSRSFGLPTSAMADSAEMGAGGGGVVVEDLPAVGDYDPEVVSADDADMLIEWLRDNDYVVTEAMEPLIEGYVGDGLKFLGVKLLPGADASSIAPLKFTCPQGAPLIPLRLTAVASEPEMSVVVFIAGDKRYAPTNYRGFQIDKDDVRFDPVSGVSNYFGLVSWEIDKLGGQAFVTQYADDTEAAWDLVDQSPTWQFADDEEARTYLHGLLSTHGYLTRLYTRISGTEMADDPIFQPVDGKDVDRVFDLSDQPAVEICNITDFSEPACGQMYCGQNAKCAVTEDENGARQDGCVCPEGTTARVITRPVGFGSRPGNTVTCQRADFDMLQSLEEEGLDPCFGVSCGGGECVPVNGFATCECPSGEAGIVGFSSLTPEPTCATAISTHGPTQLLWDIMPDRLPEALCRCTETSPRMLWPSFALVGLLGLSLRRRRR